MQKYIDVVEDQSGRPVAGASVLIMTYPGGTVATIYSDAGGTVNANPMTTAGNGQFSFYAPDGHYSIQVSGPNIATHTISDVSIVDMPALVTSVAFLYPGTYASPPTTRPDGSAMQAGDRANFSDGYEYVYSGSAWSSPGKNAQASQTAAAGSAASAAHIYAGTYATPPTTRPPEGTGAPMQNGDIYTGADGFTYARISSAWVNQTQAAATSATTATTQAGIATTQAGLATTAKTAAEAARDAANTAGRVYADTTTGIAGTTNGQSFNVYTGQFCITYQNQSGVAVELGRFYVKSYLDAWLPNVFESLDPTLPFAVLLDSDRRVIQGFPITTDAAFISVQNSVNALTASATASGVFETLDPALSGVVLFLDSAHRILGSVVDNPAKQSDFATLQSEVTTARGTQTSLDTRVSHGLTPYGDPVGATSGVWSLREVRYRLRKIALGESIQLVLAFIGDSYTQAPNRYVRDLTKTLQTAYGSAGAGWVGFAWFGAPLTGTWTGGSQPAGVDLGARDDLITTFQIIGTWTSTYATPSTNCPSISYAASSTAGDYIRLTVPSGNTAAKLFYGGDGTGVVAVSWDDGATYGSNINLNTSGAGNVDLSGVTAGTMRIKVVSGNVALAGIDLKNSAAGVRVHKLGQSGSNSLQWAGVTQANWAAQILALGAHMHSVMHGTNDQNNRSPDAFAINLGTIFANLNSVLPYSDRLIVMPAENNRTTNTTGMPAYAAAARAYARANDIAFMDLQNYFGPPDNFGFAYAAANAARPWMNVDLIHPDPPTGGRVMVDAFYRLLTAS